MDAKLSAVTAELKLEAKFSNFFNTYTDMTTAFNSFNTSVLNYIEEPKLFLEKLQAFTTKYEDKNYEFKLVEIATSSIGGLKSLVESYKEVALNYEKNYEAAVVNSTSKLLFEFYVLIMMRVFEGFSLLRLCFMMQQSITRGK